MKNIYLVYPLISCFYSYPPIQLLLYFWWGNIGFNKTLLKLLIFLILDGGGKYGVSYIITFSSSYMSWKINLTFIF